MENGLRPGLILGIGNPLLDISAQMSNDVLTKYGLTRSNAILAEAKHAALYDEITSAPGVEFIAGGATQNSIRCCQWMLKNESNSEGVTRYIGCVGKDENAKRLEESARKDGVDVHYMIDETTKTGRCAVVVSEDGDRSLVAELAAANNYKISHLEANLNLVKEADIFYSSGFFLTVSPDSLLLIGKHAAENNKSLAINLAAPFVVQFFWDGKMEAVMPYCDYVFGNNLEAEALSAARGWGTTNLREIAEKIAALPKVNTKRPRTVVITNGAKPIVVKIEGYDAHAYATPCISRREIKDMNGAGDAFLGGFLSHQALGRSLEECISAGSYAAGYIIRTSGVQFNTDADFQSQIPYEVSFDVSWSDSDDSDDE